MNNITKYQKYLKKLGIILGVAFIISFFLYHKLDNKVIILELNNIKDLLSNNHFNLILLHFIIISVLIMLILMGLGFISIPLYFLFEIVCMFYNMFLFINIGGFKGLIFSLIYNFILKGIYLILIFILVKKILNIYHLLVKSVINKITIDKNILINNLKVIVVVLLLILINDILLYFLGTSILLKFIFILK